MFWGEFGRLGIPGYKGLVVFYLDSRDKDGCTPNGTCGPHGIKRWCFLGGDYNLYIPTYI